MKLLINAKIFPNIQSKSILIKNNKIKFIGDLDDINISSKSLDIIDCENNSVLPGFIDSHIHLFESISNLESIDLSEKLFNNRKDIEIYFKNFTDQKSHEVLKFHGFEHRNIKQKINIEFFESMNFVKEGMLRDKLWRDRKWHNSFIYSKLVNDKKYAKKKTR